jgi:hypothetical protein
MEDDGRPLARLKPEDLPRAPRRLRSQLVAIDGLLLAHQDDVETLFGLVSGGEAREVLRRLFGGLEETHRRLEAALRAVERGG